MNWSLHQLFPLCLKPDCPKFHTRHMLDVQVEVAHQVLQGEDNYIYWQAGVGASKTLLWGALAAAYMIMIPGCRIILARRDFALLYDTLWRYFKESMKAAFDQGIVKGKFEKSWRGRSLKATSYCELPNGSWARAVQLKNISEAMGPNYDAIFISDAMENPDFGTIFRGEGTVGGLQSRLRNQVSSFFQMPDGTFKDMRRFLIESNPPPAHHDLWDLFGKESGVRHLGFGQSQITYRHIQTSNIVNDHNPASYRTEIASMHSDVGDQKRILEGQSVPYYGGIRVMRHFYPEIHVNEFDVDKDLPLKVGIDPGKQHPAVLIGQVKRCTFDQEHFIALSEITNLRDVTTRELVDTDDGNLLGIVQHLGYLYPAHFNLQQYQAEKERLKKLQHDDIHDFRDLEHFFTQVEFCIDRSANKINSTSKDRESDRIILYRDYGINCRYINNLGVERSLDRVDTSFHEVCLCNIPVQLINRECEMLIAAYAGGYRYTKKRDGTHSDKPVEDHVYEDIADAHRYCVENFFFNQQLSIYTPPLPPRTLFQPSWAWMTSEWNETVSIVLDR